MIKWITKTAIVLMAVMLLSAFTQPFHPTLQANAATTSLDPKSNDSKREFGKHHFQRGEMSKEKVMEFKLEKMRSLAKEFDIDPSGKSLEQLKQELSEAKKNNPEKWEAIKQEYHAKKMERLREFAESKGISVEGKTPEQLRAELKKLHEAEIKE